MLARNHSFQISDQAHEPASQKKALDGEPQRQSERPLFWILVILLALACGTGTYLLAPAPRPTAAPAPSSILAPVLKPAPLGARQVTQT